MSKADVSVDSSITSDDELAASVVAGLRTQTLPSVSKSMKRTAPITEDHRASDDSLQENNDSKSTKRQVSTAVASSESNSLYPTFPPACTPYAAETSPDDSDESLSSRELLPAPYFYYRDHSTKEDDDPLTPLTPLARVPNFPAKMHAILSRKDLSDVVTWLPHGRAWRVLKPREFEVRVIPTYFEHNKFSSFIRQANGWGFRRITKGPDRNSYYHELFLRGIPHLSKGMKRPGPSKKATADPEHEPDFYKISEEYPVPEKNSLSDDMLYLPSTLMGGPKNCIPLRSSTTMTHTLPDSTTTATYPFSHLTSAASTTTATAPTTTSTSVNNAPPTIQIPFHNSLSMVSHFSLPPPTTTTTMTAHPFTPSQEQVAAVQQALSSFATQIGSDPTSQFAAGFAAATALTHSNFQLALSQALEMSRPRSATHDATSAGAAAALVRSGTITTPMGMFPTTLPTMYSVSNSIQEEQEIPSPNPSL